MFTNTKCSIYAGQDKVYTESVCLSTDTKPTTGIANGSTCIEMNTGKTFMFDEASGDWVEVPSSGGGGGGGSSDLNNPIELELIAGSGNYDGALITKLTASEIYELCQTGTPYFTVTAEQVQTYSQPYKSDTKYFINEYNTFMDEGQTLCGFFFVMLSIADTSDVTVKTTLDYTSVPVTAAEHLIIAGGL